MSNERSINAVKSAIGGGESYSGYVDVYVSGRGEDITYRHVYASVSYHYGYMQMNVDIQWDDDRSAPDYSRLGLHKGYNTNFIGLLFAELCKIAELGYIA